MDKFDRFQLLHRQFCSHRRPIALGKLADALECSERTVRRTIDQMKDYLGAPIDYFPEHKGWHYLDWHCSDGERVLFELPGLWLTGGELQSLALLLQLLGTFGSGLLNDELAVIEHNINRLLAARGISRSDFDQHVKVLPHANRYLANPVFVGVCEALLKRHKITIRYSSYNNKASHRDISPQTLVYYRENWYLDAWCHLRQDLRTFSLARIERLVPQKERAREVAPTQLKTHFAQDYGIFAGAADNRAVLRFLPVVAKEIALQQWHPAQQGRWQGDDYLLTLPYSDDRELIQDILRHIPNVVVEAPTALRSAVLARLQQGIQLYNQEV